MQRLRDFPARGSRCIWFEKRLSEVIIGYFLWFGLFWAKFLSLVLAATRQQQIDDGDGEKNTKMLVHGI